MAARTAIPRLHLVTNRHLCGDRPLADVVAAAARGGVGAVQLREKDLPTADLLSLARDLRHALGDIPLIINTGGERGVLDITVSVGAAGVHLPESAGPVAEARAALGPAALIGRSVHSIAGARVAEEEGADYAILGTIFATASKPGREPAGLALVTAVARAVAIPVIAIGGIDAGNVAATLRAGAWGVAVMSTILAAPDPAVVAGRLRRIIEQEVT
jgi:thiamine-phosphate pyrophosphorylase